MKKHMLLLLLLTSLSQAIFLPNNSPLKIEPKCAGQCMFSPLCWIFHPGAKLSQRGKCPWPLDSCCLRNEDDLAKEEEEEAAKYTRKIVVVQDEEFIDGGENINHLDELEQPDLHFGPVINDPECGKVPHGARIKRVVGGQEAGFATYPWQALVMVKRDRCGGALINRRHVVTAGHCLFTNRLRTKSGPTAEPYQIRVILGEYEMHANTEPLRRQQLGVERVILHPYYQWKVQADRYDVAVLRLDGQVQYRPHVRPICLPEKDVMPPEGTEVMVAGWGATDPKSKVRPKVLQAVDVKIIDGDKCERWHKDSFIDLTIWPDMMCAGHARGGKDACQGDSGGPLMADFSKIPFDSEGNHIGQFKRGPSTNHNSNSSYWDPNETRWTLVGLVSAGFSCAKPGRPGIYHKIAHSSDWISYATRMHRDIF